MQALHAQQQRTGRGDAESDLGPTEEDADEDGGFEDDQELATAVATQQVPMPCTFGSIGSAMSGGALGFLFGFGELPPDLKACRLTACAAQNDISNADRLTRAAARRPRQVENVHAGRSVQCKGTGGSIFSITAGYSVLRWFAAHCLIAHRTHACASCLRPSA